MHPSTRSTKRCFRVLPCGQPAHPIVCMLMALAHGLVKTCKEMRVQALVIQANGIGCGMALFIGTLWSQSNRLAGSLSRCVNCQCLRSAVQTAAKRIHTCNGSSEASELSERLSTGSSSMALLSSESLPSTRMLLAWSKLCGAAGGRKGCTAPALFLKGIIKLSSAAW